MRDMYWRVIGPKSEPGRKNDLWEKRLARLRGAVKAQESTAQVHVAVEKLRFAKFALLKAQFAILREYPSRDPQFKEAKKLCEEAMRWTSLSTEQIVQEFGMAQS